MKLSTDKIEQLAAALVDQLAEIDGVLFRGDDSQLRLAAQQIISRCARDMVFPCSTSPILMMNKDCAC